MPDTRKAPAGPEEGPARTSRRRLVRWIVIVTGIILVLALWVEPI